MLQHRAPSKLVLFLPIGAATDINDARLSSYPHSPDGPLKTFPSKDSRDAAGRERSPRSSEVSGEVVDKPARGFCTMPIRDIPAPDRRDAEWCKTDGFRTPASSG
jgi:hypothetical protein